MKFGLLIAAFLAALAPLDARAALPPSELVEQRLEQAREARKPQPATLRVTVTGDAVREYSGEVKLVSNTPLTLRTKKGKALRLGGDAGLGTMLGWLLLDGDLIDGLTKRGDFRPKSDAIEVVGESFGYRYGVSPAIVVSRSLDRCLIVRWSDDGVAYDARFEFGEGPWPTVIAITRNGAPYVRLEVEPKS